MSLLPGKTTAWHYLESDDKKVHTPAFKCRIGLELVFTPTSTTEFQLDLNKTISFTSTWVTFFHLTFCWVYVQRKSKCGCRRSRVSTSLLLNINNILSLYLVFYVFISPRLFEQKCWGGLKKTKKRMTITSSCASAHVSCTCGRDHQLSSPRWTDAKHCWGHGGRGRGQKIMLTTTTTYWWWRLRRARPGNPRWPARRWWDGPSCGVAAWRTWAAPPPRGRRVRRRGTTGTPSTTSLTGGG